MARWALTYHLAKICEILKKNKITSPKKQQKQNNDGDDELSASSCNGSLYFLSIS